MANTVILGTGIIGLSTAYNLSQHQPGSTIHLVDSSPELFASASGYAGGFIAKDWFRDSVSSLGELSFKEHKRLAEAHQGREKWGYSKSVSLSYEQARGDSGSAAKATDKGRIERVELVRDRAREGREDHVPRWLRRSEGDILSIIDEGEGTAILDPLKFCEHILKLCKESGVHVHYPATALSINADVRGELASVRIGFTDSSTETEIPATRLLISCGGWTPRVFENLFPDSRVSIPVATLAGHSLVVKAPESFSDDVCYSIYCDLDGISPEIYSRSNGVIYITGVNSSITPLPDLATDAEISDTALIKLKNIAKTIISLPEGDDFEIVRSGLCFRPVTDRGTPILGRVEEPQLGHMKTRPGAEGGVFIAVGHGPWGISLSQGTGKVMAEMMQGKPLSADISQLGLSS